ncbi:sensor domain-containing diguanylate cyclase [Sporosarcina sp. NCCP-2716]|uniref:sensor domain-containing diguanylate cyclase n=1 Tax=Sporosarcina sp. NCCP-2716 TaxID=2943679 RepID=UPI00203E35F5|nr:sensor domain-containing diguanylate cyclase [Sporosarcina sp. NCCP-2716]GKV68702.1 sensor domain-containing diguanylate cyclase [Sporosarcina sp. NCCP-2716]
MKMSIKQLLLLIALLSITLTLASSLYAGYRADQEALKNITLETNSAYAQKLAKVTEEYLLRTERTLAYSADTLKDTLDTQSTELLNREAERLAIQSESLSSVVITDQRGIIRGSSKRVEGLIGQPLQGLETTKSLHTGMPEISEPFVSQTGRLIVFISTPIVNSDGRTAGLIGGSIYLSEENVLYNILGQHFYEDGSYVYVVSRFGMLMYHIQPERVGEHTAGNPVIEQLKKGNSGSMQLLNSTGRDMLAGYAVIPLTGWGVVSQRPTEKALAPSGQMVFEMVLKSLPFLIASALLVLFLASQIAKPLVRLASFADGQMNGGDHTALKSGAWYREAIQLDRALTDSFSKYKEKVEHFIEESSTDALTGLLNRRALSEQVRVFTEQEVGFSLIILDIDRFKLVNDTFGHTAGDEVLKFLADKMKAQTGSDGSCYRYGGEEFVIVLPQMESLAAARFADRLRIDISSSVSPVGRPVTFSAGVAEFPVHADHIVKLIELADECLYEAKETGRNRVVSASDRTASV